jgi:DNA-binding XRE family transcriptional regulator
MTATSKQEPPPTPTDAPVAEPVGEAPRPVAATPAATTSEETPAPAKGRGKRASNGGGEAKPAKGPVQPNNVRKLRQAAMMSKAELARRAGVSPLTIDRVESGCPCRMDTKRKILEALGLSPSAREQVFGPDIDQG